MPQSTPITDDELAEYEKMIEAADFGILRTNPNNPRYIEELRPGYSGGGPVIADVSGKPARADLMALAPALCKLLVAQIRRYRRMLRSLNNEIHRSPPSSARTVGVAKINEILCGPLRTPAR